MIETSGAVEPTRRVRFANRGPDYLRPAIESSLLARLRINDNLQTYTDGTGTMTLTRRSGDLSLTLLTR
jgi:hypothetical protein